MADINKKEKPYLKNTIQYLLVKLIFTCVFLLFSLFINDDARFFYIVITIDSEIAVNFSFSKEFSIERLEYHVIAALQQCKLSFN